MPIVKLANCIQFECRTDQTVLDAARGQGIILEHSCRTGRCGVCKARVLDGETDLVLAETFISERERSAGFVLTCCRTASTDIELDIEDLGDVGLFKSKTLPCRVDSITRLCDDVVEVVFRTPSKDPLEYLPGQYVDMIGGGQLRRSYSIANAPREDGKISLHIRRVDSGKMSKYWFEEAKANDLLRLEGPLGTFCLRKNEASNLILLATGTGIAPIKAILEQLSIDHNKNTYRQVHLYWGGRTENDIYWKPVFPELPLRFVPVLSRSSDWSGKKGYIQNALAEDGIDLSDSVVYACGSEQMIHGAYRRLTAGGLRNSNFYSDAFVSSS